jgi:UDP-N-acetylmuramyl pentapeptide phosphotransferase/UDP-N-acetylglucosamine-1-phosphate transferase
VLLGLYYAADATITLLRRLTAGEPVWQAHRSHFYQRALNRGLTVPEVIGRVFAVNLALAALALASLWATGIFVSGLLVAGFLLVAALLVELVRQRPPRS